MWPVCTCSVDYTDIPEREYYVAPRKNRSRRHLRLLPFLLALLLFGSGFLLGRTQAAQMLTPDSNNAGFPHNRATVPTKNAGLFLLHQQPRMQIPTSTKNLWIIGSWFW